MSDPLSQYEQSLYMDAMGLTLWTSRYRLPNAEPTPACEWPEDSHQKQVSPTQRLKALRQDTASSTGTVGGEPLPHSPATAQVSSAAAEAQPADVSTPESEQDRAAASTSPQPARQASDSERAAHGVPDAASQVLPSAEAPSRTVATSAPALQDSLAFSFHAITFGQRWWILSPQQAFDAQSLALMNNVLMAIGCEDRTPSHAVDFQWPMIEGFKVEDPQAEAEDGVLAFIAGQQEQQGQLQTILLLADEDENTQVLSRVLGIKEGMSTLLELPVIRGAALPSLLATASAKRALWQALAPFASSSVRTHQDT